MKSCEKTVIRTVLEEELARNLKMQNAYTNELNNLPKGIIEFVERNGHRYCYLKFRDGKRVIRKYLGKFENTDIESLRKSIERRKYFSNVLKDLKNEEDEIKKALK